MAWSFGHSNFIRSFREMIILTPECIPAKDHEPDSDGREDDQDDDPYHWIIDIFFSMRIDMNDCTIHQGKDDQGSEQEPENAEKSLECIHDLIINVFIDLVFQVNGSDHKTQRRNTDRVPEPDQRIFGIGSC